MGIICSCQVYAELAFHCSLLWKRVKAEEEIERKKERKKAKRGGRKTLEQFILITSRNEEVKLSFLLPQDLI